MDSVNQRVNKLIERLALSKSEFSQKTGISAVVLSHISSGRNKVSLTAIQQILKAYPEINPGYLLLGSGSMFVDNQKDSEEKLLLHLDQIQKTSEDQQARLYKMLESLREEIRNK
jgi:hypothetical protein